MTREAVEGPYITKWLSRIIVEFQLFAIWHGVCMLLFWLRLVQKGGTTMRTLFQRRYGVLGACAVGFCAAFALPAHATLTDVSIGTLTFSNFTATVTTNLGFTSNITPAGITDTTTPPNSLTIQGAFEAGLISPPTAGTEDVVITYKASSTTPITAVDMNFNGVAFLNAVASVTESVGTSLSALNDLGQITVTTPAPLSVGPIPLSTPENTVYVTKDIQLDAAVLQQDLVNVGGSATISVINQSFEVPEPASLGLLGIGLLGLGLIRRWRRPL